jgi:uncharacterized membrane protein (UPF0127 family)
MRSKALLLLVAVVFVGCRAESPPEVGSPTPTDSPRPSADASGQPAPTPTFGHAKVLIDTQEGSVIVDVEEAETPEQRAFGLMFRESLGEDEGMVFLFDGEQTGGFYMKNTLIPLSIAFFGPKGHIVDLIDMEPCEADPCEVYTPDAAYVGALEVNQGAFEEWGVQEGDRITVTR